LFEDRLSSAILELSSSDLRGRSFGLQPLLFGEPVNHFFIESGEKVPGPACLSQDWELSIAE
jgi:hypothetical protein